MPETPATGGGFAAGPRRSGFRGAVVGCCTVSCTILPTPAGAQTFAQDVAKTFSIDLDQWRAQTETALATLMQLDRMEVATLGLTFGFLSFAVVTATSLVRTRRRTAAQTAQARDEIITLKDEIDRAKALLLSEPQVLVSWPAGADEPEILGDPTLVASAATPHRALAFGTWLDAEAARDMEHAVDALRATGESFNLTLTTTSGRPIEAEGRAVGGRAVLRLRDVTGAKRELAELVVRHDKLAEDMTSLRTLVEALPAPIWSRDDAGRLVFANSAYARAVEAKDGETAMERGLELFDRAARVELVQAQGAGEAYQGRLPAIVAGQRRNFDVLAVPTPGGSAGIALDATETETMRAELKRMVDAHRRTLDQLATGVAIFGSDQKLAFYNDAYRSLWDLDAGFLDQTPSDSAVLDQMRASRKLPEQQDFRQWKAELHEAYRATDPTSQEWHLPDGRTLRVVTTPNPEGGVIYLFEDVTERLDLARRYDALIRVQGETLDNLAEAVAVFGSDGRLRLNNPSFARLWRLEDSALAEKPHVEAVIERCQTLHSDKPAWQTLRAAVTAIDAREPLTGRMERHDGSVVDYATVPLPDGATLVTFQDVTDTVNVERALRERNEALEEADGIKINFVHHVSYELRSPLTNIIGFTQMLGEPTTGELNPRQREYLDFITSSSNALLALTNNILDLASIDAGAITLNLAEVDIRKTMESAAEGVQDRLVTDGITLTINTSLEIGNLIADERRICQALFNLLSNAVGFSPPGGTVTFSAERSQGAVTFSVTDSGPGIPPEMMDRVFDWFETHSLGSRHRGTGLGLALVRSFVELHGGTVRIDSEVGRGTTVSCSFPIDQAARRSAAE